MSSSAMEARSKSEQIKMQLSTKQLLRGTQSLPVTADGQKSEPGHRRSNRQSKVGLKKSKDKSVGDIKVQSSKKESKVITSPEETEEMMDELGNSWLDYAMEIAASREQDRLIWDLRDTWLDIVEMNWMDSSGSVLKPNDEIFRRMAEDDPPLPPKFDSWSNGTLEVMPAICRESVLDPFIRSPWYFDNAEQTDSDQFISSNYDRLSSMDGESVEDDPVRNLARPKSPVKETMWSTTTMAGGSFKNLLEAPAEEQWKEETTSEGTAELEPLISAAALARMRASLPEDTTPKKTSVELLYKRMSVDIKASSELAFVLNDGKAGQDKTLENGNNDLIAFKLPNQTSSESIALHVERRKENSK